MAFQRKYKFNWLDYLYYMGANCGPTRWPKPFEALIYSILMWWPFVFALIFWGVSGEQLIGWLLYVGVVFLSLFSGWPLKKYWFTPERERAYFRRYPHRKYISLNTVWWFSVTITVTNIIAMFLVLYLWPR